MATNLKLVEKEKDVDRQKALDAALAFVRAVSAKDGVDMAAVKRNAKDLAKRV